MAEEYIKRNSVMDRIAFCIMEDPETKIERVTGVVRTKDILAIPAADVVEVVRCEECRFSETCSRTIELIPRQVQNGQLRAVVHYCEYGERRDNNAD